MNRTHATGVAKRRARWRRIIRPFSHAPQRQPLPTYSQMAAILENACEAVIAADLEGRITYWNRAAQSTYGYRSDEVVGRHATLLYPREQRTIIAALFERLRRGESVRQYESVHLRRDGTAIPVLMTLSPMLDEAGNVIGVSGINLDITDRCRAEGALRRSEAMLFRAQRIARIGTWEWDIRKHTLTWTPEVNRLYGYPEDYPRAGTYNRWLRRIHPDDRQRVHREVQNALRGRRASSLDFRIRKADGSACWVHGEGEAVFEGRKAVRFTGTIQDISERKHYEEALRESEARYRAMVETAQEGVWFVDARQRTSFINPRMASMLGYQTDEVLGRSLFDFCLPEDLEAVRNRLQIQQQGVPTEWELRFVRCDGSHLWAHGQANAIFSPTGEYLGALAMVQDIGRRKERDAQRAREVQAIQDDRAWLEAVIEHSPIGIALVRKGENLTVRGNPRLSELLGRPIQPGMPFSQLASLLRDAAGNEQPPESLAVSAALQGETRLNVEKMVIRDDDTRIPVLVHCAPIHLEDGMVNGAIMMVEDISVRKDIERMRQEWSTLIAHELRQPASNIILRTQILRKMERVDTDIVREHTDQVLSSAALIERMIDDLQNVSQLESQRLKLQPETIDLVSQVGQIVLAEQPTCPDRRIRVFSTVRQALVHVDAVRMRQVIGNLLSNAFKYGFSGTDILVRLRISENQICLSICNQGPGIKPEDMPHLFHRFYRAADTARKTGGLGLGLYMVRGLVEAHGGSVWAESEPGRTTTFHLALPQAQPSR